MKANALRQVTQFADYDITFPALGPDDIVVQAGGRLYLLESGDREDDVKCQCRSSPIG